MADLNLLPLLPPAACEAHLFPHLASGSLTSIGQLSDHGCSTTLFTATTIASASMMAWCFKDITHNPNLAARIVAFYHAAMFSPVLFICAMQSMQQDTSQHGLPSHPRKFDAIR
jgi:hypothetical protein